jgi:DNA-binding NtrC family response regulator
MPQPPDVVAVVNTSPDVVDMLRLTLEHAGIVVVSAMTWEIREGEVDLERFVAQHRPRVIVYDIAPPYERNWRLFEHLRETVFPNHPYVLTSTNAGLVRKCIDPALNVFEVLEKPYSLDAILQAVRTAMERSPNRQTGTDRAGVDVH